MKIKRHCDQCGGQFLAIRSNHRFCSDHCRVSNFRANKAPAPEVKQVRKNLYAFYKEMLESLSDKQLYAALAEIWTESPQAFRDRINDQSMLKTLMEKNQ